MAFDCCKIDGDSALVGRRHAVANRFHRRIAHARDDRNERQGRRLVRRDRTRSTRLAHPRSESHEHPRDHDDAIDSCAVPLLGAILKSHAMKRLALMTLFVACAAAPAPQPQPQPQPSAPPPSTIESKTAKLQKLDGFIPLYWDAEHGKLLM